MVMQKYAAFLRGINVGKKKVSMAVLKKTLEELGYHNIRTVLNSGNVVFETAEKDERRIRDLLEEKFESTFGFHIDVMIRTMKDIIALVDADPFKSIPVTAQTRLYVTFLSDKPTYKLAIPYESPEKNFTILQIIKNEIYSVLTVSKNSGSTDVMNILEKEFGKKITTRNWNTVVKVAAL